MANQIKTDKHKATSCFERNEYEEVLNWYDEPRDKNMDDHVYLNRVNQSCYFQVLLGEYSTAIKRLEAELTKPSIFEIPSYLLIDLYFVLGEAYYYIGEYEKSKTQVNRVLDLKGIPPGFDRVKSLITLGKCFWKQGFYGKAVMTYLNVLSEMIKDESVKDYHVAKVLNLTGIALLDMGPGFLSSGKTFMEESIKIYENSILEEDHLYYATCLSDMGYGYLRYAINSEFPPGIILNTETIIKKYFEKALGAFKKVFGKKPHRYFATTYKFMARLYRHEGNREKTIEYLEKEERIRAQILSRDHPNMIRIYNNKCSVYLREGDITSAERWADRAFECANGEKFMANGDSDTTYSALEKEEFGALPILLRTFYNKARVLLIQNKLEPSRNNTLVEADRYLGLALQIIRRLRQDFHEDGKLILAEQTRGICGLSLDVLYRLNKGSGGSQDSKELVEKFFRVVQSSKALLLLETIRNTDGIGGSMERPERSIKPALKEIVTQLNSGRAVGELELLGNMLEPVSNLITANQFTAHENDFYVQLKEVQAILTKDTGIGIISYFLGEENSYGILVTEQETIIERLPIKNKAQAKQFREDCENFRAVVNYHIPEEQVLTAFHDDEPQTTAKAEYQKLAHSLYLKLVKPFPIERFKRLYIIPDEYLALLPFEALLTEEVAVEVPYSKLPYLIHKYIISYHSAIAILHRNHVGDSDKNPQSIKSFLVIAAAGEDKHYFDREMQHLKNFLDDNFKGKLEFMEDESVTGDAVLEKLPHFDIVHLSAHGENNEEGRDNWDIRLRKKEKGEWEKLNPSTMRANLLSAMRAKLVTLHSCSTGIGTVLRGEGVMALNRSFIQNNAKNIVYTLGEIPLDTLQLIIIPFYKKILLEKMPLGKALQEAKLESISLATTTPFDWAEIVFMGNQLSRISMS